MDPCHMHRLPQELLQAVLKCLPRLYWPHARLVCQQFESALAPLITTITIRQWPVDRNSSKKITVSGHSSLKVQHVQAVVDNSSQLATLLHLVKQLPQLQHVSLRGLKPLSGGAATQQYSNNTDNSTSSLLQSALAGVTQLDLPDSNSSSLPKGVCLPGLMSMRLYALDSLPALAAFAPNLQRIECFSLTAQPSGGITSTSEPTASANNSAINSSNSSGVSVLAECRELAVAVVNSSSAKTAVACMAAAFPSLRQLLANIPQLQLLEEAAAANAFNNQQQQTLRQECEELTLHDLQQALPLLQAVVA